MIYYLCLYFICITSLILYYCLKIDKFKIVPYITMAFFCGFRGEVGVDTNAYIRMFSSIRSGHFVKAEWGYYYLVKLVQFLNGTQQWVFLIMACLTLYFMYKFIDENSEYFEISTIIYLCVGPFYFSSYNTVREALAVAIFLYALKYLENKPLKYAIWILVAGLFHMSALLFLLMLLVDRYLREDLYISFFLSITIAMIVILKLDIIQYIIRNFLPQYRHYIDVHKQDMDISYVLFCIICLVIIAVATAHWIEFSKKFVALTILAVFFILVPLVTQEFTMLFTRIASYVTPAIIVMTPQFNRLIKQKYFVNILIALVCTVYYFVLVNTNENMINYTFNFM